MNLTLRFWRPSLWTLFVLAGIVQAQASSTPVGTSGAVTLMEDMPYSFAASDFGFTDPADAPANLFTGFKVTTLPTAGILTLNGNLVQAGDFVSVAAGSSPAPALVYTPAANRNGLAYDSFTFQVQDDGDAAANLDPVPKTLTLNVSPVNDPPAAPDGATTGTTGDQSTITISFPATDPDNDPVTLIDAQSGDNVKVDSFTESTVTFTPAANAGPTGHFTYTVSDGQGGTATGTITVQISDNDAPVISTVPATVNVPADRAGRAVMPNLLPLVGATDNRGIVETVQDPIAGSALKGSSVPGRLTVKDAAGNMASASTNVVVTPYVEHAPVFTSVPNSLEAQEGSATAFLVTTRDDDGDAVALSFSGAGLGTVSGSGGQFLYTPFAGVTGVDNFTINADDGHHQSVTVTVVVSVSDKSPPVIANLPPTVTLQADRAGFATMPSLPGLATITDNVGVSSVVQSPEDGADLKVGTYPARLTVRDAAGNSATAQTSVVVVAFPEHAPIFTSVPVTLEAEAGVAKLFTVATSDEDGDAVTVRFAGARKGAVRGSGDQCIYKSNPGATGSDSFTITADDGYQGTVTATVMVMISDTTPPAIEKVPETIAVEADRLGHATMPRLLDDLKVTDYVGVASAVQTPAAGTALGAGTYAATLVLKDAAGNATTAQTSIVVTAPSNAAPVFISLPDGLTLKQDTTAPFFIVADDADGDLATFTFSGAQKGSISGAGNDFVYTPAKGATGSDSFIVTADDGFQGITTTTIEVSITPVIPGLAGHYHLLLSDEATPRAELNLTVSSGFKVTGTMRREDNRRRSLRKTALMPDNSADINFSDGSTLSLRFDGFGAVEATLVSTAGYLSGTGTISPSNAPVGLPGTYTAAFDLGYGGFGWSRMVVGPHGTLRIAGRLPNGKTIKGSQGTTLDRSANASLFLIGLGAKHPYLAGVVHFEPSPTKDMTGNLLLIDGDAAYACAATGSLFTPAHSALPPDTYAVTFDSTDLHLDSSIRLDAHNRIFSMKPVVSFHSGSGSGAKANGLFTVRFHESADRKPAGPTFSGTGVFLPKLNLAVGEFSKDGETGGIVIGDLAEIR